MKTQDYGSLTKFRQNESHKDTETQNRYIYGTISYISCNSRLAYDLQEPLRWLVDLSVVQAFESGALDLPHFYFTGDDYRYRFDAEAKTRKTDHQSFFMNKSLAQSDVK